MHSYWSDGRAFPEQAISMYKERGYDFISLSDHNIFASGSQRAGCDAADAPASSEYHDPCHGEPPLANVPTAGRPHSCDSGDSGRISEDS